MAKLAFKYFLLSCFVLLSGYNQLSARSYKAQASKFRIPQAAIQSSEHLNLDHVHGSEARFVKFSSSDAEDFFLFENEEEDEIVSFKKHLNIGGYFTSVIAFQTLGILFSDDQKVLPAGKAFFNTYSDRYLMFEVFRI